MQYRRVRIQIMMIMTGLFFLVELIVGYLVNSLALVADSFHMLSDVLSLVVGYYAIKITYRPKNSQMTFGWVRAEIIGALINAVFLIALCVTIAIDAIQRIAVQTIAFIFEEKEDETHVDGTVLLMIVGGIGLLVNLIGLCLFHQHGHGHSHGDENGNSHGDENGHSHGDENGNSHGDENGHSHDHNHEHTHEYEHTHDNHHLSPSIHPEPTESLSSPLESSRCLSFSPNREDDPPESSRCLSFSPNREDYPPESNVHFSPNSQQQNNSLSIASRVSPPQVDDEIRDISPSTDLGEMGLPVSMAEAAAAALPDHEHHLNIKGIFLHVLGDALGSVAVVISGAIIHWVPDGRYGVLRHLADPVISLVIVLILLYGSFSLAKTTARILFQTIPKGLNIQQLEDDLHAVETIDRIHELHIWQLTESRSVATMHMRCPPDRYMILAQRLKEIFHRHNIHSTTIQPEFAQNETAECLLVCQNNTTCHQQTCCVGTMTECLVET